jgi:hypothetical protein
MQSHFAQVLGIGSADVTVRATAKARPFTTLQKGIVPWAVMDGDYVPGSVYAIYADHEATANNGAVSLPTTRSSGGCAGTGGGSDYRDVLAGPSVTDPCPVTIGQELPVESGGMTGPTRQGLDTRIGGALQPVNAIVQFNADGSTSVLNPDSPQLVRVMLVRNATDNSTTWPTGGNGTVRVVGFASFVITAYSGQRVDGMFIRASSPEDGPTGDWSPPNGIYQVTLSG